MSKFSLNTLHLENSEEAAIVVTTAHHYCPASSGHEECGAPDRRPSSQVSASQLRAANHWNVSRNVSYRVHCILYRIVSWARRIVSALVLCGMQLLIIPVWDTCSWHHIYWWLGQNCGNFMADTLEITLSCKTPLILLSGGRYSV